MTQHRPGLNFEIDDQLILACRRFLRDRMDQRRAITMNLKMSLARDQRYEEIGHRLGQLKPFIDYIYDEIIHQYHTASAFYTQCNISRQVYSQMQQDNYDPKLETVYKIMIGLRMSLLDAVVLMENAGYTFTYKTNLQLVIIFCIVNQIYTTQQVDSLLVEMGLDPLFSNG